MAIVRAIRVILLLLIVVTISAACGEQIQDPVAPTFEVILPQGNIPPTEFEPPSAPPRRYDRTVHEVIPQNDYGPIWPYVGGFNTQMWMLGELIGLCTSDGSIICDPIYNSREILEKDGKQLYMLKKHKLNEDWVDLSTYTLTTPDGSWVKEYDKIYYQTDDLEVFATGFSRWRKGISYDYITVLDNGKWGVIDYEGNTVLPSIYNSPVLFSEGLAAVQSDDEKTYNFIDALGNVVLGPMGEELFSPIQNILFCEGHAKYYEDGKYGLIDRTGNVVIPAEYDFISSLSGGIAQFFEGDTSGIIDVAGNVVFEPTTWPFYKDERGEIIIYEDKGTFILDIITGEKRIYQYGEDDYHEWFADDKELKVCLDDDELVFKNASSLITLENWSFAISYKDETWQIYSPDGEPMTKRIQGYVNYYRDGLIYVINGYSQINTGYDMSYKELYDQTGKQLLSDKYLSITPFKEWYMVRQDYYSGLVDENGNWVVKVPLYDYIGD